MFMEGETTYNTELAARMREMNQFSLLSMVHQSWLPDASMHFDLKYGTFICGTQDVYVFTYKDKVIQPVNYYAVANDGGL